MRPVQVQLLGSAIAVLAGRSVAFLPDKRFLLLAYLANRGDWVGREELAHLFWSEVPDGTARHRLRQLLKRVRQIDWVNGLEAEPQRLRWATATDVEAVRAALADGRDAEAARLYRGPLLHGLDGACPTEYHRWLEVERRDLHERWRAAILRRGHALEAEARPAEAAELYASVRHHDPFDEEVLVAQLRALSAAGEPGRARSAWRVFADTVRRELGIEPREATARLAAEIERGGTGGTPERPAVADLARASEGPAFSTPFVGREVELAEVAQLLGRPDCRLLTIAGPGGVGKTRLARRAVDELAPHYPGGVHIVPTARLRSVEELLAAIATVLAPDAPGRDHDPLGAIRDGHRGEATLLVLDALEHLAADSAPLASVLMAAPALDLLVTSRHRLGVDWEWSLPIEGLPWPPPDTTRPEECLAYDAVRLFVELAGRRAPFAPGPAMLPDVIRICAAVRGLPLAIELAAAWIRALPLPAIAERIERDHDFLAAPGGAAAGDNARGSAAGARRQSVRAAFDHSWSLLTEVERTAFARLSVFPGGFRAAAAEAVTGTLLPVIVSLVDKSLLRLDGRGGYDRHPLLRQYAAEVLAERPDLMGELRDRHARYVLAKAEALQPRLSGPEEAAALERLDDLHDDCRAALDRFHECREGDAAVRLCAALGRSWLVRGRATEGLEQIERALALPTGRPRSSARAAALNSAGLLRWARNEYARAVAALEQSLELRRALRDRRGVAATLNNLGAIAAEQGELARARALHEESLAIKRSLGDTRGVAMSLNNLGIAVGEAGDRRTARSYFEESLAAMRASHHHEGIVMTLNNIGLESERDGDLLDAIARFEEGLALARSLGVEVGVARLLNNLGRVRRGLGEHDTARAHQTEGLATRWRIGSRLGVADSLEELAGLHVDDGASERAAGLLGAAAALRDAVGVPSAPLREPVARDHARARDALGDHAFAAAWARGRAEPIDRIIERELASTRAGEAPVPARDGGLRRAGPG